MPAVFFFFRFAGPRWGLLLSSLWLGLAGPAAAQQQPLDSLRAALRTEPADTTRAKTALRLSAALTATDTAAAGQLARQALAFSTRAGFGYGQAHAWLQLGSLAIIRNDNAAAARLGRLAQAAAAPLTRPPLAPRLRRLLASIANNRGNVADHLGQYGAAVRYYLRAAALLAPTPDHRTLLTVYGNLGNSFRVLGQPAQAARYWRQAVALGASAGPAPELVPVYLQLAGGHLLRAQPDSAWQRLRAARQLLPANALYDTEFYSALSEYYLYKHQPGAAQAALRRALAAAARKGATGYQAKLLFSLGQLEAERGQPAPARAHMQRSLALTAQLGDAQQLISSLDALAQLEENAGQWQAALGYFRRSHALRDTLANTAVRRQAGQLEARYRSREQDRQLQALRHAQQDQQEVLRQQRRLSSVYLALVLALAGAGALALGLLRNRQRLARQQQELQAQRIRQLEQGKALLRAQAVLEGQEEERGRVARDLHDGLGGMLATVRLYLGTVRSRVALPAEPARLFAQSVAHLDGSIAELRRVARNLMPEAMLAFGLTQALQDLCATVQQTSALRVQLHTHGLEPRLPPATEAALYRMVQELLTNVVRHAQARQVLVQLMRHANALHLVVEDDGRGFDAAVGAGGVGLRSVRARAAYLGGTLEVQSAPGQGTTVSLELQLGPAGSPAIAEIAV